MTSPLFSAFIAPIWRGDYQSLRRDIWHLQLEQDLLKKANEIVKKGLGVDLHSLSNRENVNQRGKSSTFCKIQRCGNILQSRYYVPLD
jgi:hypothetical protein